MGLDVLELRENFPKGTKVRLIEMVKEDNMPSGLEGVVNHVDDFGNIHVLWSNGSTLNLLPDVDKFEVI